LSSLLIAESPLMVQPTIAALLGLQEALVLQQIHYLSVRSANHDGWVHKTIEDWCSVFPFASQRSLERTFQRLREQGLLLGERVPGGGRRSRFRVDHDALDLLTETAASRGVEAGRPIRQSGGTNPPIWRDQSANLAGPIRQSGGTRLCKGTEELKADSTTDAAAQQRVDRSGPDESLDDQIDIVFAAWATAVGDDDAVLDSGRRRTIRKGLKSRPPETALADCVGAVRGWRHSAYHCGRNPDHAVINKLSVLLRDAETIETLRDLERDRGDSRHLDGGNVAGSCPGFAAGVELSERWAPIVAELQQSVPESTHDIWLRPLHPHADVDGTLVVGVPPEIATWVSDRFRTLLDRAAAAAGEQPITLVECSANAIAEAQVA